jgi:hypothetical protein
MASAIRLQRCIKISALRNVEGGRDLETVVTRGLITEGTGLILAGNGKVASAML